MTVPPLQGKRGGRPLAVLGAVLGLWILARALLWESPFPITLPPLDEALMGRGPLTVVAGSAPSAGPATAASPSG